MNIPVNYLSVLVATIAGMVVGFIWYGPLFGKTWIRLTKFSQTDINKAKEKGMGKTYFWAFIVVLIFAYVLANFVYIWGTETASEAFQLAFWIWLGFVVTIQANAVLWGGKPFQLYIIDIAHYLVVLYVMSLILTLWS